MENKDSIQPKGTVEIIIEHENGKVETIKIKNAVLKKGREAIANSLAGNFGSSYQYNITQMLFGDGGTSGGVPKFVNVNRNGLFGITRASKGVIASIDPNIDSNVIFTAVLTKNDANGFALNEMALQMANGDVYSMATFPDLNKTSSMQITWNWRIAVL